MQNQVPPSSRTWRPLLWSATLLFAITSFFTADARAQNNICELLNVGTTSLGECCFKFIVENDSRDTTIKRVAVDVISGSVTSASGPSGSQVTRTSSRVQWSFSRGLPSRPDSLRACFSPAQGSSTVLAVFRWYRGDGVLCTDTIRLNCGDNEPPKCVSVVEQEIACVRGPDGGLSWKWNFNVKNLSINYGRSYRIVPTTAGIAVSPNSASVSAPVAPNGIFPRQNATITGGQQGQLVSFNIIMCGSSGPNTRDEICCTTTVQVRLPECPPVSNCLTILEQEIFCDSTERGAYLWCFAFRNTSDFPIKNIKVGTYVADVGIAVQPGATGRVCIKIKDQPGPYLAHLVACSPEGIRRDTINGMIVTDTLERRCCEMNVELKLPECEWPDGCFEIVEQEISCDSNGAYRWCFNVRNHASWTMGSLNLEGLAANSRVQITPNPITFPNGVRPGALSQRICVTIYGAKPGVLTIIGANTAMELGINCRDSLKLELPECEPMHRECCDGFLIGLANDRPVAAPNGVTGLIGLIAAGPAPITKVSATIVSSSINGQPAYGYAVNGLLLNGFGVGTVTPTTFGQEIIWSSPAGVPMMAPSFTLNWLRFPPMAPNARTDTLRFCIRWRFTDKECRTCDTLVCYRVVRRRLLEFDNVTGIGGEKGMAVQGGGEFVAGELTGDNSGSVRIVLPQLPSNEFGTVTYTGLSLQATDGATITSASDPNGTLTYGTTQGLVTGGFALSGGSALDLNLDYEGLDGRPSLGHLLILSAESSLMPGELLEFPVTFTLRSEGTAGGDKIEAINAEVPGKTIRTFALHVRNQNGTEESLSGLRLHASEGMTFLAVGPTSGEREATLRFGVSDESGHSYISEAAEGTVMLEPGMERRPIYLTVAMDIEFAPIITFATLNAFDEVVSEGEIDLLDISSVNDNGGLTGEAAASLGPVRPNPTTGAASLVVSLPRAESSVALVVRDAAGREVLRIVDGEEMAAGSHIVTTDLSELASGVYFITLETASGIVTQRTTVTK